MRRETITPRPDWQRRVEDVGLEFHTQDGVPYWAEDRCYAFTVEEIDGIEALTNDLHKLCLDAVEQIVRRGWHSRLAIPEWGLTSTWCGSAAIQASSAVSISPMTA
jgi:glutathionylspermidine synthase